MYELVGFGRVLQNDGVSSGVFNYVYDKGKYVLILFSSYCTVYWSHLEFIKETRTVVEPINFISVNAIFVRTSKIHNCGVKYYSFSRSTSSVVHENTLILCVFKIQKCIEHTIILIINTIINIINYVESTGIYVFRFFFA